MSNVFDEYCGTVLQGATIATTSTMPQGGGNGTIHTNWLLAQCDAEPITGTTVPVEGFDPEVVSPPLLGPIYACSTHVLVSGLVYGASLSVELNGNPISVPGTAPGSQMVVDMGVALVLNDVVRVTQTDNDLGLTSAPVQAVVEDHQIAYPSGLPAPIIKPTPLYTCARSLGVQNIPGGVELIVDKTNTGTPVDTYTMQTALEQSWVLLWNEPAFVLNDSFTVKQQICEANPSPPSNQVTVVAAPTSLGPPAFVPDLVAGQQIADIGSFVQGAHLVVRANSTPIIDWTSVPYTFFTEVDLAGPLGAPVSTSDNMALEQELCGQWGRDSVVVSQCDPNELLAQIAPPVEGDDFVVVIDAVPGATIHVTAQDGHIGSASGPVVGLTRALLGGETIVVIEELVGCLGTVGYEIAVLDLP